MKKSALLLGALIIFVTGCGIDDAFRDEPELTSLTGILSEQKSNDAVAGTHLLYQDEGDGDVEIPVRSLSVNLSGSNYLDNRVQIIGFLNQDDGVFEVTGISVVEALHEIVKDPKLAEYKNTDFGKKYSFSNMNSYKDYSDKVPINSYSSLDNFITREKSGERNVLTKNSAVFFATSSGTTGKPKFIPINSSFLKDHKIEIFPLDILNE